MVKKLIEKAKFEHYLAQNEIVKILEDNSCCDFLFSCANNIREKYVGNEIHLRGLIEFSNVCKQNCNYCGIRAKNQNCKRYRLSETEIEDCIKQALKFDYKTLVLQSGEDEFFTTEKMCKIIEKIKINPLALTLSIGEKTYDEYKAYKKAGADRYLLRIETTDSELYKKVHPNMSLENRKTCLLNLKQLGYETGTGSIVGIKGQSLNSLADDILFFKKLDADMIGIGPFIACPDTPFENEPNGDFILSLKVMAITRLLLPNINIPATTAMETLNPNGRLLALQCGANVVMPNITQNIYKEKYKIYPTKIMQNDLETQHLELIKKFNSIGRTISKNYGFRQNS